MSKNTEEKVVHLRPKYSTHSNEELIAQLQKAQENGTLKHLVVCGRLTKEDGEEQDFQAYSRECGCVNANYYLDLAKIRLLSSEYQDFLEIT